MNASGFAASLGHIALGITGGTIGGGGYGLLCSLLFAVLHGRVDHILPLTSALAIAGASGGFLVTVVFLGTTGMPDHAARFRAPATMQSAEAMPLVTFHCHPPVPHPVSCAALTHLPALPCL